jgi:hypothetical protein
MEVRGKEKKVGKGKYSRYIMFKDNGYLAVLKGEAVGPSWCTEKNLAVSLFITNLHGLALDRTWASVVHK